jgi:hypothetical protein
MWTVQADRSPIRMDEPDPGPPGSSTGHLLVTEPLQQAYQLAPGEVPRTPEEPPQQLVPAAHELSVSGRRLAWQLVSVAPTPRSPSLVSPDLESLGDQAFANVRAMMRQYKTVQQTA